MTKIFEEREDTSEPIFTDVDDEKFKPMKIMFAKNNKFHNLPAYRHMFVSSF